MKRKVYLVAEGALGLDIALGIEFIRLEGIETFLELRSVLLRARRRASWPCCLPRSHNHRTRRHEISEIRVRIPQLKMLDPRTNLETRNAREQNAPCKLNSVRVSVWSTEERERERKKRERSLREKERRRWSLRKRWWLERESEGKASEHTTPSLSLFSLNCFFPSSTFLYSYFLLFF